MTNRGVTGLSIPVLITGAYMAVVGIAGAVYNIYGTTSSLTASVGDIQKNTDGFPQFRQEVEDYMKYQGYRISSSTAYVQTKN